MIVLLGYLILILRNGVSSDKSKVLRDANSETTLVFDWPQH